MNAAPGVTVQSSADDYTSLNFMIGFYNYYIYQKNKRNFIFMIAIF